MTIMHDIKESINTKLDAWDAKASAMEAQLELTRDQALDRLEEKNASFVRISMRPRKKLIKSSRQLAPKRLKCLQQ